MMKKGGGDQVYVARALGIATYTRIPAQMLTSVPRA